MAKSLQPADTVIVATIMNPRLIQEQRDQIARWVTTVQSLVPDMPEGLIEHLHHMWGIVNLIPQQVADSWRYVQARKAEREKYSPLPDTPRTMTARVVHIWYAGDTSPMGPIRAAVVEEDKFSYTVDILEPAWLRHHGLDAMRTYVPKYPKYQRLLPGCYAWFGQELEHYQSIPEEW